MAKVKNAIIRIVGGLFHVLFFAAIAGGVHFMTTVLFGDYEISLGYRIAYGVMAVLAFTIGTISRTTITVGSGDSKGDAEDSGK